MTDVLPKLGIIAGGGSAPRRVIEACQNQNRTFHVIALEGQCDPRTPEGCPCTWLPLGAFEKLKKLAAQENFANVVMIGHVRRPSLKELKPDWLALKLLTKVGVSLLGDDALLRAVGHAIETECGVKVIGAHEILGGILLKEGPLGQTRPSTQDEADIAKGIKIAHLLGQADVGQSVVVQQGLVLGVEAIEGTDALIARCKELRRDDEGGVLVKMAKPQQDDRFDLPTIGPHTLEALAAAGLKGLAAEAGRTLLIDRNQVRQLADEKGLFIVGIEKEGFFPSN